MSRLCKQCNSKKKSSISYTKNPSFRSPEKYIHTEYGLAKVVEPQNINYHQEDNYMLARFQKTINKLSKLEK